MKKKKKNKKIMKNLFFFTCFILFISHSMGMEWQKMEESHNFPIPMKYERYERLSSESGRFLNHPSFLKKVTFLLKHRNVDLVKKIHRQVSDPHSPQYGEHLTIEQLNKIWAPKRSKF